MPSALTRSRPSVRPRSAIGQANLPRRATPIAIVGTSIAGSTITLTFDQPVLLSGVPQFTVDGPPAQPLSAQRTSAKVVTITYSAAVTGATQIAVAFEDPAIRNASGGFVNAGVIVL